MGRAILPKDASTWNSLLAEHRTISAVAALFGVSQQAASRAYRKAVPETGNVVAGSLKPWLPWRVRKEHQGHQLYTLRQLYARRRQGLTLDPRDSAELDAFMAFCENAVNAEGREIGPVVIAYWRETVQGFHLVPAEPGDADGVRVEEAA